MLPPEDVIEKVEAIGHPVKRVSPTRAQPALAEPPRFTFEAFQRYTQGLHPSLRLVLFNALPEWAQDEAWLHLENDARMGWRDDA
jgi:hypothetical protein